MIFCPRCGTVAGASSDAACARCGTALARPQVERAEPPNVRAPTNRGEAMQRAAGIQAVSLPKAATSRPASAGVGVARVGVAGAGAGVAGAGVVGAGGQSTEGATSGSPAQSEPTTDYDPATPDPTLPVWGFPVGDPQRGLAEGQAGGVAMPSGQGAAGAVPSGQGAVPSGQGSTAWPPPPRQWPGVPGSAVPTEAPPAYPPYAADPTGRWAGPLPEPVGALGGGRFSGVSRATATLRGRLSGPDRSTWGAERGEPPNYFWVALVCIFLFLPTGVAASLFSLLSTSRARSGDLDGSWRASRIARGLCIATIPFFLLGSLFVALGIG